MPLKEVEDGVTLPLRKFIRYQGDSLTLSTQISWGPYSPLYGGSIATLSFSKKEALGQAHLCFPRNHSPDAGRKHSFMLDRLGEDCAPLQFLRELNQNAIEGIQRLPEKPVKSSGTSIGIPCSNG